MDVCDEPGRRWQRPEFDHLAESFELTRAEHRVLQDLLSN
jgi:hypothetical protein